MATQRTPRNSGHLSVADTLAAKATPPGGGLGLNTPRNLPRLNGMRAPPPPLPVNRPACPQAALSALGRLRPWARCKRPRWGRQRT